MSDQPNFDIELPEPWYWTNQELASELRREIPAGHLLDGVELTTLARRQDQDDVLFKTEEPAFAYVIVHLTWRKESDPRWPTAATFETWDQVRARIEADAREFE